jgi:hypothetical protein
VRGRGFKRLLNHGPDALEILQNVVVLEADEAEALAFEICSPASVAFGGVLAAVDLDDQAPFRTQEIDDVAVDLHLLPEFDAIQLTAAQDAPEFPLGIRGVLAERSRSACQEMVPCHFAPSPRRCAPTLSREGERVTSERSQIHA